jgi:TrmH family RNA methyltransferase
LQGKSIYAVEKPKEGLLIIGNEGQGIRDEIVPFIKHPVTIPRIGGAESLNAGVATGIVISHLV